MRLTNEQKILLGVLGAGVVALGVNYAFFSPKSARAADDIAAAVASDPVNPAADTKPGSTDNQTIEARLAKLRDTNTGELRDAFAPGPGWVKAHQPPAVVHAVAAASENGSAFAAAHKLLAVMTPARMVADAAPPGESGSALVDGVLVRVGQYYDGYILQAVGRRWAMFERHGVHVRLVLQP